MTTGDLYNLLGLSANASPEEIKTAYFSAARRFHPDSNPNPGATEEFKLVADAYSILSDPAQRSTYDKAVLQTGSGPLLAVHAVYSRQPVPAISEAQVLYALVDIQPSILTELPDPPINLCLVLDRSTSMQGARLDQVKGAVGHVIDSLRESDTFSVVAFSDKAEVIVSAQRTQSDRTHSKAKVSTINAQGGTEILQGLLCGLTELHHHLSPAAVNHLLLLTDGRTYGDEDDCLMLARLAASDGIAISGLGIGNEWNDRFMDELTGRTGGTAAYISSNQEVSEFIQTRVRGLGSAYAERLNIQVTLDPQMELVSVFKVSPEAGPVPIEQPLRLGSLPKRQPASVLFKFRLPPLAPGMQNIARLSFFADVVSLGRRGERMVVDLALPVVKGPQTGPPPPALVEALGKLSQYQLQEHAWQQAAAGDLVGAAERLKTLGTRLLAGGQPELARLALSEATRLEKTQVLSEETKKMLKYGTRALIEAGDRHPRRQMITCANCRNREIEGELYCSECGARLPVGQPLPTSTAAFVQTRGIREPARAPSDSPAAGRLQPGQIGLSIEGTPQPVLLEGRPEYILGREGSEQVTPDLNLNPYGGREKGVSRVHAALRRDRSQVLLIDLGSTNGTRLNGKTLAAHQPIRVDNGDEIRLGRLLLIINFVP